MNKQDVLKAVIDKYGEEAQCRQVMEECAELIQATNKTIRYPTEPSRQMLIKEMADVTVMLEQLAIMFNITSGELETAIDDVIKDLSILI